MATLKIEPGGKVTAGKGAKDRYTLLSETALTILREYFRAFKP